MKRRQFVKLSAINTNIIQLLLVQATSHNVYYVK